MRELNVMSPFIAPSYSDHRNLYPIVTLNKLPILPAKNQTVD